VTARRLKGALVAAVLLSPWTAWSAHSADDLRVAARLQPEIIGIDEYAHLTIEVQSSGLGGPGFEPSFELDNLEIVNGPSTSQNLRFINGVTSRSLTLSWLLRPLAVGPARVHSIEVQVDDEVHSLPEKAITVQEDAVGRPEPDGRQPVDPFERFFPRLDRQARPPASSPRVFLRAEIRPKSPFVGQQALYTLYLFTQADVTSITPEKLPEFNGLWVRELPQKADPKLEMVDVDGERFGRIAVLQRAIFPLRAGSIELDAAKVQLGVRVPDRVFGSMLSQTEQVHRDSNAVTLAVRDLPGPAPEGFHGAVGELQVTAELAPPQVEIGDAATFSVTLSGIGHLQGLPPPVLPEIAGLRAFPPQQDNDERVVNDRVQGRRTWSYVLGPEVPGRYELPAIDVPYFDPTVGEFRTARAEGTTLEVEGTAAAAIEAPIETVAGAAATANEPPREAGGPTLGRLDWPRMLPWALVVLLIATLSLVLRGRFAGARSRGPAAALSSALRLAASQEKPREAAALIEEGWRRFLEARWGIPPGTPSTQWGKLLSETGVPADSADRLVELADDLHYLRYAPQLSDTASLTKELIFRSTKLGRTLK
jgi:hypothetical protein